MNYDDLADRIRNAPHQSYVFVERPRCPACHSPKLRASRSTNQGDGSIMRHTRCQECGERFKLILE